MGYSSPCSSKIAFTPCCPETNDLLEQILVCLELKKAVTVISVCSLDDPPVNFLVQVTYDPKTEAWEYTRTDGTVVVEGVDFVICDSVNQIDCNTCP